MAHGRNSAVMIMALGYSQVSFRSVVFVMVCVVRCSQGRGHGHSRCAIGDSCDVNLHRFYFSDDRDPRHFSVKRGSC